MNPVLVELPSEVHKIQAFREGISHPGWNAPVILILETSFVVINSETGSLLRTFPLPADRSRIVDCKYISSEKSFLVATDDGHLIVVPENSKGSAEYSQHKWPVKVKEIVVIDDKSIAIVSENDLALTTVEQGRVIVPNYAGAKLSKKPSSLPYLKKVFSSCGKIIRVTAQTKVGVQLYLWEYPSQASNNTEVLLEETATSHRMLEEIRLETEDIHSILVDSQKQCIHFLVHDKPDTVSTSSKKGKANEGGKSSSRWLKFDLLGHLLFERPLTFVPKFACLSSDRLWLLTESQELTSWSARYGTLLQTISITAPIQTQLCDLVHQDGDQGNYSLLYGLTNRDGQATTIFRYDVGGVSTAPVSLAALELNTDHVAEYFAHDKQKRRKTAQSLPLSSVQAQSILQKHRESADVSEADWLEILMVVRLGVFSIQSHRGVWQAALAQERLDVLSEMIRFAADVNEFQVVDILKVALTASEDTLRRFSLFGGNLVYSATKDDVMKLLSDEERNVLSSVAAPSDASVSKKGKKAAKGEQKPAEESTDVSRTVVVRAVVESVLYRVPRFSPTIVSEAMQGLPFASASLVLRMLVLAVRNLTEVSGGPATHVYPYLGAQQLLAAIEWMEAIMDSHFSSFLFEADQSIDVKRCLQGLVRLVKHADDAIETVEEARGLWADIERSLTRQGVQPRVDPGLYTVEVLRL
eukprot:gene2018-1470_t